MIEKIKETYLNLYERLYNDLIFSTKYFLVCTAFSIYIKIMEAVTPNNPITNIATGIYLIMVFPYIHAGLQKIIDRTQ